MCGLVLALAAGASPSHAAEPLPLVDGRDEACPPENTERFKVFWAERDGESRSEALTSAKEVSRLEAVSQLCVGLKPLSPVCVGRQKHAESWARAAEGKGKRWKACVAWGVPKDKLRTIDDEAATLAKSLKGMAAKVAAQMAEVPERSRMVSLHPPTWGSNCAIGRGASAIRMRLQRALQGAGVKPAPISMADRGAKVFTELAMDDAGALLAFYFVPEPGADPVSLGTIDAPRAILRVDPKEENRCVDNTRLGLERGGRPGNAGLGVQLTLNTPKRTFCDAEPFTIRVNTTREAHVRVYSVDSDGVAYLAYPARTQDTDLVKPGQPLEIPSAAAPVRDGGDETLIAVAVPKGFSLGALSANAFCRMPGSFGSHLYAKGAAVSAQAIRFAASGDVTCKEDVDRFERMDRLRAALSSVAECQ